MRRLSFVPTLCLLPWGCDASNAPDSSDGLDSVDTAEGSRERILASTDLLLEGATVGDRAGRYVARAGDVDADGTPDLYIGADHGDGNQTLPGRVYIVSGASLPASGSVELMSTATSFLGEEVADMAGHSGGHAGDVDGDGADDLVISAYHASDSGLEEGRVYLVRGGELTPGSRLLADADWTFGGSMDYGRLGHGLSGVGDVDGDGRDDVMMGLCCGEPASLGAVWIALGGELGTGGFKEVDDLLPRWDGAQPGDGAGVKIASGGDVDGDGLKDSMAAARLSGGEVRGGRVYLIPGSSVVPGVSSLLSMVDQQFEGVERDGELGYSLGTAGDVDGDGLDDLLMGAYHAGALAPNAGVVYLFFGAELVGGNTLANQAAVTFDSAVENMQVGVAVTGGLNVDGDDLADFVVGASGVSPPTLEGSGSPGPNMDSPGDVWLFRGASIAPGSFDVATGDLHIRGAETNDHAGISVATPGDLDGDGQDDLLVGGERGQEGVGRAWLLFDL